MLSYDPDGLIRVGLLIDPYSLIASAIFLGSSPREWMNWSDGNWAGVDRQPLLFRLPEHQIMSSPAEVLKPSVPSIPELEQAIYLKVNRYRQQRGLPALQLDSRISTIARRHSQDMADRRISFGHQNLRYRALAVDRVIASRRVSENVAYVFSHQNTADRVVQGWLRSAAHRSAIEGEFRYTGVGVAQNDRGAFFFTQIYVRPL